MPQENKPKSEPKEDLENNVELPKYIDFKRDPESFPKEVHIAFAKEYLDEGDLESLRGLLKYDVLSHLDNSVALKMIQHGLEWDIAKNVDSFDTLSQQVAQQLFIKGLDPFVAGNLEKFTISSIDLLRELTDLGYGSSVIEGMDKFVGISQKDIVSMLLEHNRGGLIVELAGLFDKVDKTDLANKLFDEGWQGELAKNFDKFEGVDQEEFAKKFLEKGYETILAKNIDKFPKVGPEIVEQLMLDSPLAIIQKYHGQYSEDMIYDVIKFSQHNDDIADAVVENISNFQNQYLFSLLKAAAHHYSTGQKILKHWILGSLQSDQKEILLNQIARLEPVVKGVKKENPYARDSIEQVPSSLESQNDLAKQANEIMQFIKEPLLAGEDREWYQIVSDEILGGYEMLTQKLDGLGKDYPNSGELLGYGKANIIRDFYPTYQRLVAEYLVLMHLTPYGEDKIHATYLVDQALQNANEKFIQVLKVDTKYYDHLYREWDHKREGSLDFEEVFLGRDGVYAYVGRVAQILARRKAVRLRGMELSETEKQLLQMPTYMIYPRGFRDNLDAGTKNIFINQQLKNPDNASFYDTGFTGTIPQDIMQILGIPREQWDSRTRLLSASARERTITGLQGNKSERDEVVNTIEYNVKPTETAEGLFVRQLPGESEERLVPFARPTDPGERLAFRMVQQALYRHYFVAETQRLEGQEHLLGIKDEALTRADGGDVHMRVDQGVDATSIGALRDLFGSSDLGADLASVAEAIKIASPDDPFPNEAVYEMKLPTNTGTREVIVKAIVPEKSHGPLDEYAALRLLDSLGIESAKPLARVFLPGDEGAGFVVMDKLPGVSGRFIFNRLLKEGASESTISRIQVEIVGTIENIAEQVRRDVGLDKPWRLKDFMIELSYDSEGKPSGVKKLIPIDFERVRVYDPDKPCEVKL